VPASCLIPGAGDVKPFVRHWHGAGAEVMTILPAQVSKVYRAAADKSRAELEKRWLGLSFAQVREKYLVFHAACLERLIDGLRRAGVTESAPRSTVR
jgi:hypothetical protein